MVLSPEHLSAHCALAGWVLGRHFSKCYLIWQHDRIDLDYTIFFSPPRLLFESDASASVVRERILRPKLRVLALSRIPERGSSQFVLFCG